MQFIQFLLSVASVLVEEYFHIGSNSSPRTINVTLAPDIDKSTSCFGKKIFKEFSIGGCFAFHKLTSFATMKSSAMRPIDKMLVTRPIRPFARSRLFCFPWAGGGTGFFAKWGGQFPPSIEVCVVRLPGREVRMSDDPYTDWSTMIDDIIDTLLPKMKEMPFCFIGHSFGALLAFEIARHLKERHALRPKHMYLSGTFAPQGDQRKKNRSHFAKIESMTDKEFVASLDQNGGTPKELLENEALLKIFLPSIKHDFRLVGRYSFEGHTPVLECPVTFLDGLQDKQHDIEVWKEMTSGEFTTRMLPGGHFFLLDKSNEIKIIDIIKLKLK